MTFPNYFNEASFILIQTLEKEIKRKKFQANIPHEYRWENP